MVEVKAKSGGGGAVGIVAGSAAPLAVCWIVAQGAGSGNWLDGSAVVIGLLGFASVTAVAWLLSKISHGGDWALRAHKPVPRPSGDRAAEISEVVG